MKIFHCADIHLDSKIESRITPSKARQRREEVIDTFLELIAKAGEEEADAVIIAGDLFDNSTAVSGTTAARVLSAMGRNKNVRFFYLSGNHDAANPFDDEVLPDNLYLIGNEFTSYDLGGVTICGTAAVNSFIPVLDKDRINILVLHGDGFSREIYQNRNISYIAAGHYHEYKEFSVGGVKGCYSGCLEGRGFDECGAKGYLELNIDNGEVKHTFKKFCKRENVEVRLDMSAVTSYGETDRLVSDIAAANKNNLVKLILCGEVEVDAPIHMDSIKTGIKKCFHGEVVNQTNVKIRAEDYRDDISLKGFFVREVLASDLSKELQSEVVLLGLTALRDGKL